MIFIIRRPTKPIHFNMCLKYMGAGILPCAIYKGKLYFLFGKENKFEDSAKGFSDFGGGTDGKENFFETAVREGSEELTGFLGTEKELKQMVIKKGTYTIDYDCETHTTYRTHIFPLEYDDALPFYYNNNQRFLQKRLDPKVYKESKLFEKAEIRWICIDDLRRSRNIFRNFFRNIIDKIVQEKSEIYAFLSSKQKKNKNANKTKKNKK